MDFEVFIGWDPREALAWNVACASLQTKARRPVPVRPLGIQQLTAAARWNRPTEMRGGVMWDVISNLPCSTEFSIARFGVPLEARARWALFVDVDFLFLGDVWELMDAADPKYAVMVVKHEHRPAETEKMDGQIQRVYARKNWSSCMLWNMGHAVNTAQPWFEMLNTWHRDRLHAFEWVKDELIGDLPGGANWNFLVGSSDRNKYPKPRALHYTAGTPDMAGFEHCQFASEWHRYAQVFMPEGVVGQLE